MAYLQQVAQKVYKNQNFMTDIRVD